MARIETPLRDGFFKHCWRQLIIAAFVLVSVVAHAQVDLLINHSDTGFDPVPAGGDVVYRLSVRINAPFGGTANNLTLTDTLPSGTTFVSATIVAGGGSCGVPVGNVLTCITASLTEPAECSGTACYSP